MKIVGKVFFALVLSLLPFGEAHAWGWEGPFIINSINYDNQSKRFEIQVTGETRTFIYDCDQSGNSPDEGKIMHSTLLTAYSIGKRISFDTQNISGSTTIWELRQLKIAD